MHSIGNVDGFPNPVSDFSMQLVSERTCFVHMLRVRNTSPKPNRLFKFCK